MEAWEKKTGGKLLAIPHNGNLSNGRMFALTTFSGDPLTGEWAESAQRWEPMYEATQIKGDRARRIPRSRRPTSSPSLREVGPRQPRSGRPRSPA